MSYVGCFYLCEVLINLKTDVPDGIELGGKIMKKIWIGTIAVFAVLLVLMVACKKVPSFPTGAMAYVSGSTIKLTWNSVNDANSYWITDGNGFFLAETYSTSYTDNSPREGYNDYRVYAQNEYGRSSSYSSASCYYSGNGGGGASISAPTGVSAEVSGSRVCVTWNSVSNASYYKVYRASSSSGSYSTIESSTTYTYYYDASPNTYNYYKVTAVNSSGTESEKSDYTYCYYSSGGGGGGGTTVPDAPTGVEAHDNSVVGETWVLISWNSVSNATSYKVYRSSSANGSYSLITTTEYTSYNDRNPMNGSNYYKVKAVNSAGESSYSSYAYYNNTPTVYSPCPVTYTSHTASSYQITLRWTNPTTFGCGTPTTAYLRVRHPETGDYVTLETLSGSASSASFSYGMWANSEGYVYCGIITENSSGTSGGVPLVYNWKTDTWYGGKGLEMTEEMEKEWKKFSK